MKKIILAVAIVCAATMAQAAAAYWTMTAITASPANSSVVGAVAYFMDASTWDAFSAAAADKKGAFCAANNTYSTTVAAGRGGVAGITATSGSYNAGDVISAYIVVFDTADAATATYYANTEVATVTAPGAGNAQFVNDFATHTAGWQSTAAVPEPTSGLLLLIGMAGLALRRKRA